MSDVTSSIGIARTQVQAQIRDIDRQLAMLVAGTHEHSTLTRYRAQLLVDYAQLTSPAHRPPSTTEAENE